MLSVQLYTLKVLSLSLAVILLTKLAGAVPIDQHCCDDDPGVGSSGWHSVRGSEELRRDDGDARTGLSLEAFRNLYNDHLSGIKGRLEECGSIIGDCEGETLTLILGATGAGKSTLVNALCDVPLCIAGRKGLISVKEGYEGAAATSWGMTSTTMVPRWYEAAPVEGYLIDVPGFDATGGFVEDIANALTIRDLLVSAKAACVVYVISHPEIEAGKGHFAKRYAEYRQMLRDEFLLSSSLVVLNQLHARVKTQEEADEFAQDVWAEFWQDCSDQSIKSILPHAVVHGIAANEESEYFSDIRCHLANRINSLNKSKISKTDVRLSSVLNFKVIQELKNLFKDLLAGMYSDFMLTEYEMVINSLRDQNSELTGDAADRLMDKREQMWISFQQGVLQTDEYNLLEPVSDVLAEILESFKSIEFSRGHDSFSDRIRIEQSEQALRRGRSEIDELMRARSEDDERRMEDSERRQRCERIEMRLDMIQADLTSINQDRVVMEQRMRDERAVRQERYDIAVEQLRKRFDEEGVGENDRLELRTLEGRFEDEISEMEQRHGRLKEEYERVISEQKTWWDKTWDAICYAGSGVGRGVVTAVNYLADNAPRILAVARLISSLLSLGHHEGPGHEDG